MDNKELDKIKERLTQVENKLNNLNSFAEFDPRFTKALIDAFRLVKLSEVKLSDLGDVNTSGVTNGQVIKYDSATKSWLPGNDNTA